MFKFCFVSIQQLYVQVVIMEYVYHLMSVNVTLVTEEPLVLLVSISICKETIPSFSVK